MPSRIEDYAVIADCRSLALVAKDGSIDWLCLPRFDSDALFAALLGTPDNGRWRLAPAGGVKRVRRRYREGTLILETEFETGEGSATVLDMMPIRGEGTDVLRIVVGNRGRVPMRMELIIRFGYGSVVPWVQRIDGGISSVAGPDCLRLHTPVRTRGADLKTVADFTVGEGDRVPFVLTWWPSHLPAPAPVEAEPALKETEAGWRKWTKLCGPAGPYREMVQRSLMTLKALTYEPTGGIAAAATTSLPEKLGGRTQLGLPLLLAARRDLCALRPHDVRLPRRSPALARVVAARGRRQALADPDHVRPRRRTHADRNRA